MDAQVPPQKWHSNASAIIVAFFFFSFFYQILGYPLKENDNKQFIHNMINTKCKKEKKKKEKK